MSKVLSLSCQQVIKALRRDGWLVIRQKAVISDYKNAFPISFLIKEDFMV